MRVTWNLTRSYSRFMRPASTNLYEKSLHFRTKNTEEATFFLFSGCILYNSRSMGQRSTHQPNIYKSNITLMKSNVKLKVDTFNNLFCNKKSSSFYSWKPKKDNQNIFFTVIFHLALTARSKNIKRNRRQCCDHYPPPPLPHPPASNTPTAQRGQNKTTKVNQTPWASFLFQGAASQYVLIDGLAWINFQ
jgi:hypothetical protein